MPEDRSTPPTGLPDRRSTWRHLASGERWDVVVVGGGITGAGVVLEAARLGYRALLLEQRDFAWGTSSRSSKLVHGGLRYLASGQFRLTREALVERERLLAEAPGLVRRLPFHFPLYRGEFPPRWAAAGLFWLYDRLAGVDDHKWLDPGALRSEFPGLDPSEVLGAYRYGDAVTDDARLVLRLLREATARGATLRSYTRVETTLRRDDRVVGVRVRDRHDGESLDIPATVVVDATGAWAGRLGSPPPGRLSIRPQRGSHIVLDAARFPAASAIYLRHPADGRRVFIYPWEGRTIVGTTDIPHEHPLEEAARITEPELRYLLAVAGRLYAGRPPEAADVISTWSGVRPILLQDRGAGLSAASREHRVWSEPGLVSCSGGKLTTFGEMAADVLRRARTWLPPARGDDESPLLRPVHCRAEELAPRAGTLAPQLLARYGDDARGLVADAGAGDLEPLAGLPVCLAELRWSLRHESVVHLDDLLLRRSRLGLLLPRGGEQELAQVERLCREGLGWDDATWRAERARYLGIIARNYSLPQGPG